MAENESLDIGSRHGQRWKSVIHTAHSGRSAGNVVQKFKAALHGALRKTVEQMLNCGVTIRDFLAARNSPKTIKELLRKCKGHDYARMLVSGIEANPNGSELQVLIGWLGNVRDAIASQMEAEIIGTDHYPSVFETATLCGKIESKLERDIRNVATKLLEDPTKIPKALPDRVRDRSDSTETLLTMSLINRSGS